MSPKGQSTKSKLSAPITAVKYRDKRANMPIEELRDFVADDEKEPKKTLIHLV